MKKLLFTFILGVYALSVLAQPGCPNITASSQTLPCGTTCTNLVATYFNVGSTTTYDVTNITYAPPFPYYTGTSVLLGIDDTWSQVISLPFNFCFFGTTFNQLIIGSNGVVSFDVTNAGLYNSWPIGGPVPANTPSDLDASIMGVWEDIDPTNRGTTKYQIGGSYPCRYFKVSWDSVPYYGDPHSVNTTHCGGAKWASTEIVLYETTNVIEIYIREKQECAGWNGGLAVEGIVDPTSTIAYTVPGRNATQWTANNDAWRFTPTSSSIVAVNWAQGGTVICTGTGDTAIGNQTFTCNVCPPNSPTTSITTPYTATAVYSRCDGTTVTETANITLTTTPSPVGGPDQNLGCYAPGLVATMAGSAFGGGTWTAVPGNPSVTVITTPSSPTTTITGFTAVGTYYYLWGSGTCHDTVEVIITASSNAGPDQTVSCATLPGGSATMAATASGIWTPLINNPGTATITTPTSPTTTITNYSVPGTYNFIWANGLCVDTAAVIVTAKPSAGPDQTVTCAILPGGSATMAATGTGIWSAQTGNPGGVTITTPANPTTTITNYPAVGTYHFIWTASNGCTDTANVVVTAKPNAGADQTVTCAVLPGGTATMTGTGTGTWTAIGTANPGTATITTPTSPTTTITTFSAAGTYSFVFTNASGCTDTANITVTTKPNAGPDQTVSCVILPGGSATMAGTGTGTWTAIGSPPNPGTATITAPTSPTTTITTFSAAGTYKFVWTNASGCTDTANIVVTAKPNAGADQTVTCAILPGGSATMTGTGTGTWTAIGSPANPGTATITTPTSPTTTITTYSAPGVYSFVWTNASGCTDTATVTVTAKPNAGPDQTVNCALLPGGTATMAGTGTGTWTAMASNLGTATITTPTSPTTTITTFSIAGTYSFIWTNASGCADTAVVTVTAKPNAGPDQTVTCAILPGGSATMAATGVGTWSAQTGNPGTATITAPTSITTTITNYSAPGTYHFIWTNASGCTDTANIVVTANPNAGTDQTVTCAALPGGTATMTGTGTGTWTAIGSPANPGTATITTPTSPITTITTFSAAGTYSFVFTNVSGCTDTANVVVTAKPNAGPDQTVSCVILPGGSATMAGTGTGTWTAIGSPPNPGTATITAPTSPTTTITTFSAAGTYKFVWTNASGCTDTANIVVTAKPNAGADQTVTCAILPGGSATMTGTGTGTWTAIGSPANPGTATITTPTSPTTTITTYSAPGVYSFVWTNASGCTDTATVTVTAKPNAGPDQTVNCALLPGGTATMAGTGTGTWTAMASNLGTATITTPTSPTTTITTFSIAGAYSFIWTNASGCTDTAVVTVTAKPDAGPDQTVTCAILPGGSATMASTGVGTWSAQTGNPGTATITAPTSNATTITNYTAPGTYHFIWANASGCTDTANVVVTAKPNAGADQTVNCAVLPGGTATMTGTGIGTWSTMPGNPGTATITSPTSPTTTITTYSVPGTYTFIRTNGTCTDTAVIVVTAKPNAGPDQTVTCAILPGGSATMAATGLGTWTAMANNPGVAVITANANPTTTITTFPVAGTYGFIWTNASGCTDTANVVVTAKPNAGTDQTVTCAILPGGSATMTGTGTGTWTAIGSPANPGTATITTPTSPTTTITTYSAPGVYSFVWTNASGCTDTATVTVTAKPNAGADQIVSCALLPGGTATMTGTGAGTWTAMASNLGTATITTPTSPTTTITTFSIAGAYSFIWTNASGCTDTAVVTVTAKPDAGPDQTVTCAILPGGSATMASTGTGTWSAQTGNPGTATITSPTSNTTTITNYTAPGTYHFIWTNASGCTDTANVVVTAKPNAGADQTVNCAVLPGGTATMTGTGIGTWSTMPGNPGTATITSPTSPTTTITTYSAPGTYSFIWTNASGCADTAVITVTAKPNAGPDQTVTCAILPGGSATMAATGLGTWTAMGNNPGTATITANTSPTTTITTFSVPGTYNYIWTNASGCADTAAIVVTAKPNAGPDQSVLCALLPGGAATMAATGTGSWSAQPGNPGPATIVSPTSPTTNITTFIAPGAYSFIWTNASGCTDTATVTVTQEPTITLANTAYCLGGSATLAPVAAPAGGTYLWNTSATTPTITVNPTTTTSFTVTYTLGSCSASAVDTVTVNPLPLATVTTIPSVCTANNGIAIANPSAGTPGYSYSWSTPPGGSRDSIVNVAPGSYTVTVTDINHCTVTASGIVGLQTPAIIVTEVSQHDLKCFNDATGEVFINTSDTARNSGAYVYTYNWSNNTHNQNLTGVQANTYTVNVTDQFGCTGTGTYTLTQPVALSATTSFVNPHCFGYADGTATVANPAGGSGAYHYAWSTTPAQTTQTATNLTANTYTVALSDDSACVLTLTVTLTDPLQITFSDSTILNPNCYGDSNGTALVAPQNGIGTYTYLWSYGSQTGNPAINLPNGTDTVTVTDGNGCFNSTIVTITQPAPVSVTISTIDASCFGSNNGSATATGAGGTQPYGYRWNTQDSTATAPNLQAGAYSVTATDNHGCSASASTIVNQPTKVQDSLTSSRTYCPDSKDGSITAYARGGTGSYTYTLEDSTGNVLQSGNTTGNFTGLGYGLYLVMVQDQNNCPLTEPIYVPRAPFNVYTSVADTVSCYGPQYHDGIIHVQGYTIPNGPFMYSVDNGPLQSIPDFFDLAAGPHTITAQDNYGCDTSFTVIVGEPLPATLEILPGDSIITPGTSLQLSTNFGPYPLDSVKAYVWTPVTGLNCVDCAGPLASPYADQTEYTLIVTYNRGCTVSASIKINVYGTPPIYIPNAFTPNGDGVDDIWNVFGTGIRDFKATVFNRWGEKVYESNNQSDGWDGTYRGTLQPPGVYVYIVDVVYLNDEKRTKQGSITLIR